MLAINTSFSSMDILKFLKNEVDLRVQMGKLLLITPHYSINCINLYLDGNSANLHFCGTQNPRPAAPYNSEQPPAN